MTETVLILGGYGVFGSRLARRLSRKPELSIIIAGRDFAKASALAEAIGCEAAAIDTQASDLAEKLSDLAPEIIVDAAGPFQTYKDDPHRVATIAVQIGAHYVDLSDDGWFTSQITQLEDLAVRAGVSVLSGVSSVPALSSVVATHLLDGMDDVHEIDVAILPGNRAPRGMSVVQSIFSQIGRPLRLWRSCVWLESPAWSDLRRIDLHVVGASSVTGRRASMIGAPDLLLFPDAFAARSVSFRAGLELSVMQYGLWILHWLPRLKLVHSLAVLAAPLKWVADRLKSLGSDRGGMRVLASGRLAEGGYVQRIWTLIVERGDGPYIPALPAEIMVGKILAGEIAPGARPCLGEFSLLEFETFAANLNVATGEVQRPLVPLFERVLAGRFQDLPSQIKDLHTVLENRRWRGEASVRRGAGWLSQIAGCIAGFPPTAESVSVHVEMQNAPKGETWIRTFGRKRFKSHLSTCKRGSKPILVERFGLMSFEIDLNKRGETLQYPVKSGRVLGVPLPSFLCPVSDTLEYVDEQNRACFSVRVSLPIAGLIAHYEGWLKPEGVGI